MNADHDVTVIDNPGEKRFETTVEDKTAFVEYIRRGDTIWFIHTEVPPELEGRGIGSALAKYALEYATTNSLKVVPACAFIEDYVGSHPEYTALLTRERTPKHG